MAEENANKSSFALVNKIMAMFNLGEAGKLDSFFNRLIKKFNSEIKVLKQNKATEALTLENKIEAIKDSIEDAKADLVSTYQNVDMSRLDNNASQDAYGEEYIMAIERAEDKLMKLEDELKDAKTELKDSNVRFDENIKIREDRIAQIKK